MVTNTEAVIVQSPGIRACWRLSPSGAIWIQMSTIGVAGIDGWRPSWPKSA